MTIVLCSPFFTCFW